MAANSLLPDQGIKKVLFIDSYISCCLDRRKILKHMTMNQFIAANILSFRDKK